jgi:outer membrane protein assembly factor BamA
MILTVFLFFLPGENSGSSFLGDINFKVGEVALEGNIVFSEKVLKNLLPKGGTEFRDELFDESIEEIIDFYLNRGFPFVMVKPIEISIDSCFISWKFLIEPGQLQRIRNIFIRGLSYTNPDYLRKKIPIKEENVFSESEIREAVRKLEKLDYIDIDSFKVEPTCDKGWVNIIVYSREQLSGNLEGVVSYSENGGFSGLAVFSNENLFGKGRKVSIELEKEGEKYQNELFEYVEPAVLSFPLDLHISLNHNYIKDRYNLISFSSGLEYFYGDASFLIQFGMEVISSQNSSYSYPFADVGFSYNSELFDILYKERFRKGRGWDLQTSADFYFYFFLIRLEYFKLSFNEGDLIFFKSFRGFPGIAVNEGAIVGFEFRNKLGILTVYPFVDANFFEDVWQYSYGFGFNIGKFSLEYAVPWKVSPSEGRIYFRFKEK